MQDGDIVVKFGEPKGEGDQDDPQAVDDDHASDGEQDKGQDVGCGGYIPRYIDADDDQNDREHQIPDPPDGDT